MAGILFVVHIPSARYERELRRKEQELLAKTATVTTEDEKDGERPSGKSDEMEPFVTPQPKKVTSKIMFSIESGPICDDVIYMLSSWGVGQRFNSTISI
ncbi:AGAP008879-PC, partial [Anopheles gambiae str. PEST]